MGKPTICMGENKDANQLRGNREADQRLVFATRIVQFLFNLNPEFQGSSSFLCLYRPVCVRPGRKPHCWFSHDAAQYTVSGHNYSPPLENSIDLHVFSCLQVKIFCLFWSTYIHVFGVI